MHHGGTTDYHGAVELRAVALHLNAIFGYRDVVFQRLLEDRRADLVFGLLRVAVARGLVLHRVTELKIVKVGWNQLERHVQPRHDDEDPDDHFDAAHSAPGAPERELTGAAGCRVFAGSTPLLRRC